MPIDWRGSSVGGPRPAPGRVPAAEGVLPHKLSSVGGSGGARALDDSLTTPPAHVYVISPGKAGLPG